MVFLVTGCRSGFGKLLSVALAQQGHTVYAGLRDLATSGELEQEASGARGTVVPVQLDVTVAQERDDVVARILREQGRIDGLVNNAGIAMGGFVEQFEEDEFRKIFEVNVVGLWALTKAVMPAMREQRSGTILNVSSMSGLMAVPGLGVYASTKFAVEGLSEALRHEARLFGIRVVLVEPGAYKTDIFERNRRICRRAYDEGPWRPYVEHVDKIAEDNVSRTARDPAEVVDLMVRLLQSDNPSLRHPIGPSVRLRDAVRRVAPFWLVERVIQRVFRWDQVGG